jgi:dolichol-phosphate mannosyltransferase
MLGTAANFNAFCRKHAVCDGREARQRILGVPLADLTESIARLLGPILVIGSSGFVGANLLRAVLHVRDDVYGTLQSGPAWRLESIPGQHLLVLDLLDAAAVRNVLGHISPRTIFHCAAYGAYSFQTDANRIHQVNYLALAQLLELLADRQVAAFVHAGSSSEYGLNAAGPSEDAPRVPNSHYAASKSAASELIAYFGRVGGVSCVNLRIYSAYGPYEDSSRLLPSLVINGLEGRYPPLVQPDTSRDFVYIDDVVAAFLSAAAAMQPSIAGQSFNIATGRRITIRQAAETAGRQFNIEAHPTFGEMPNRAWDVLEWYGFPKKAEEVLGWRAQTGLAEGLKRTAEWWRGELERRPREAMSEQSRVRIQNNGAVSRGR